MLERGFRLRITTKEQIMKVKPLAVTAVGLALVGSLVLLVWGDEFTKKDQERWQKEYMSVVQKGRELWVSGDLGTNGVACAQCHPNAANTHPETYPKFQQQLGRVIALRDMINWCLQQPLEGKPLELDDPKLIAIEAYIAYERRGVPMAPGKH
jgi:thiosulfate dehydrogenase